MQDILRQLNPTNSHIYQTYINNSAEPIPWARGFYFIFNWYIIIQSLKWQIDLLWRPGAVKEVKRTTTAISTFSRESLSTYWMSGWVVQVEKNINLSFSQKFDHKNLCDPRCGVLSSANFNLKYCHFQGHQCTPTLLWRQKWFVKIIDSYIDIRYHII